MITKTRKENFDQIEQIIRKKSGYKIPEIVSIKANKVSKSYEDWLSHEVR